MRRLYFTQVVDSRFIPNNITDKLSYMYKQIKNIEDSIKWNLCDLDNVACTTDNIYRVDWQDGTFQLRQDFTISKASKKTTWNDIYATINKTRPVKYTLK